MSVTFRLEVSYGYLLLETLDPGQYLFLSPDCTLLAEYRVIDGDLDRSCGATEARVVAPQREGFPVGGRKLFMAEKHCRAWIEVTPDKAPAPVPQPDPRSLDLG